MFQLYSGSIVTNYETVRMKERAHALIKEETFLNHIIYSIDRQAHFEWSQEFFSMQDWAIDSIIQYVDQINMYINASNQMAKLMFHKATCHNQDTKRMEL